MGRTYGAYGENSTSHRRRRFKLKFEKCKFAAKSVKYLGHFIQENKIRTILADQYTALKTEKLKE